ncbi:MAG: hypothetical protein AAGA85_06795 [Bacteroidota bacterium]
MEPFEYVVVLTSLILGLGIAQILTNVADMLSHLRHIKLSLPHSLLVVCIFFLHIQEWWINYQYSHTVQQWTLYIVLSILTYPILLFMLARMLFPTGIRGDETDLEAYFDDQWRWLYGLVLGTVFISIWQNSYIQGLELMSSWPQFTFGAVFTAFLLIKQPPQWAHTLLQVLFILSMVAYIILEDTVLMAPK